MAQTNPYDPYLIPVEGKDGWYRDPYSNAIVNCNKSEYDKYMAAHEKRTKKDESFSTLQDEVKGLKSELSDIKRLLHIIANGDQSK